MPHKYYDKYNCLKNMNDQDLLDALISLNSKKLPLTKENVEEEIFNIKIQQMERIHIQGLRDFLKYMNTWLFNQTDDAFDDGFPVVKRIMEELYIGGTNLSQEQR